MTELGSSCLCLPACIFKKTWWALHTSKMYTSVTVSNARHDLVTCVMIPTNLDKSDNSNTSCHGHAYMVRRLPAIRLVALQLVINSTFVVNEYRFSSWHEVQLAMCIRCSWTLIPAARKLICFNCDQGHASMVRRLVAIRFGELWERYNFDRGCRSGVLRIGSTFRVVGQCPGLEDLRNIWKVLRLALFFQHPGLLQLRQYCYCFFGPTSLPLEHDTRNSYVTLRAFPIERDVDGHT